MDLKKSPCTPLSAIVLYIDENMPRDSYLSWTITRKPYVRTPKKVVSLGHVFSILNFFSL
jgi:hypothetical protein